ncbi:MAG: hypothetical protein JST38_11435 [Bacteroidetes bacterium]|nr:hypothetical protein [Bacteroidota bacterium]
MRSILPFLALLYCIKTSAQAPPSMSFQAVVRDANNALVMNAPVGIRISIHQATVDGTEVYAETHSATTNANGLVSLQVGAGTVLSGDFSQIDWSAGPYFLETETDPTGGMDYSISGTQQLLSVPYALYAANGGVPGPQGPQGPEGPQGPAGCDMIKTGDGRVVVYNDQAAYGFGRSSTGSSGWISTILSGPVLGAVASDTLVVLYTAQNAYSFGPTSTGSSGWISTILDGPVIGSARSSARIVVYTATTAYGTGRSSIGSVAWVSTVLNGTPLGHVAAGNRVVVYTATAAYGFGITSTSSSGWSSTVLSSPPLNAIGTR